MTPQTLPKDLDIDPDQHTRHNPLSRIARALLDKLFERWIPEEEVDALDWVEDADRAMIEQEPLRARVIIYTVAIALFVLVFWAGFAEIDEVTRGEAKVIPSRQIQIVQSVDGGVVSQILVAEGDLVKEGQLLLSLDETRFASSLRENRAEYLGLEVKAARLRAIAENKPFAPGKELQKSVPLVVEREHRLYESTVASIDAERTIVVQQLEQRGQELIEVTALRDQAVRGLELANRELTLTKSLVESGAVSEVEIIRLERETSRLQGERDQANAQRQRIKSTINEAKKKVQEVELAVLNKAREELNDVSARINSLQETRFGLSDKVDQTSVRSPVNGTVNRLYYNTIGGVVLPGKEVVEVVPSDDALLLEARIHPKDIAFLRPQQAVLVKFTAYDFVVYGGLEGVVEHIGANTVMDEEGNPFYNVKVRTHQFQLGDDKPIIPGMVAEVDILTGKKTILAYLLKPVLRAKQYALSER
ncbi:MAG: HlyD family type I secretion periplasmic adaptor subunit [Spongiibacteraceae bacterium]|nr:HlyD family type I secretion periplasmic adaptor subunit [Spongiibacteraceae bacterium]